jgi:hypothetical protein
MGCPVIRFLPEIAAVGERLKGSQPEFNLLKVAENICLTCRSKMPEGQCALGEGFERSFRDCLPNLIGMIQKEAREGVDKHG